MTKDFTILAGSVSQGIWRSADGGETWRNFHGKGQLPWEPFALESQVRALAVDPNNPAVVYAGDEEGVYKSEDRGDSWERLHGPMDGLTVWSIVVDPTDSNVVFAGTRPPYLFRSRDAGKTWQKLPTDLPQECAIGTTRVTAMRIDPLDHRNIWVGIEIGNVHRSTNGGDSWERVYSGFDEMDTHGDIHDVTLIPGTEVREENGHVTIGPGKETTVLINAQFEFLATSDGGKTWHKLLNSKETFPLPYMRAVAFKPDEPHTIYIGKSDKAIGSVGDLARSRDGGATWEQLRLPVEPNSGVFGLATHPSNPDRVVACTLFGQFYVSEDAGDTWVKLKREVNELRALAWIPN